MTETQNANEQFDTRWEEVSKSRLIIGDEEKGVEITLDVDLSPAGILKQLREISRSGHKQGLIGDDAHNDLEAAVTSAIPDGILKKIWQMNR